MSFLPRVTAFYYSLLGRRLLVIFVFVVTATATEAFGVGLLLPLLQGGSGSDPVSNAVVALFRLFNGSPSFVSVLVLLFGLFLVRSIFLLASDVYGATLANRSLNMMRQRCLKAFFTAEYRYTARLDQGYVNNVLTVELQQISALLRVFILTYSRILFATAYVVLGIVISPTMGLVFLLIGPPAFWILRTVDQRVKRYSERATAASGAFQHWGLQAIRHARYLKATESFRPVVSRVMSVSHRLTDARWKQTALNALATHGLAPVLLLAVGLVLYYQVEVRGDEVLAAVFTLFLLKRALDQTLGVQTAFRRILASSASYGVYEQMMAGLAEHAERPGAGDGLERADAEIVLDQIGFEYEPGRPVLTDVSLRIKAGSYVAIVGASGSGKTTLATLLVGLMRPTAGKLRLGKRPYDTLDMSRFRSRLGYITQETALFNDTVRNNITEFGDGPDAPRLRDATAVAQLDDVIAALPKGDLTVIGDEGGTFSGGQRQRLSIARALYRDADILVFDEPTSGVDMATEQKILHQLAATRGHKTLVLIAHRLHALQGCDQIHVLKEGRLVESGSYKQLSQANGEFARLLLAGDTGTPED